MRIFVACQQSQHTYAIPAYQFWGVYFRAGLAEAGHVMVEDDGLDWARGLLDLAPQERASWKDQTWSRTVATLRQQHQREGIDLFLSYLFPNQVEPAALQEIRRLGIPCVNFFCDNVREYQRLPDEFGSFDLHWVPEHAAQQQYRQRGWPFVHAPMPCWVPPAHRTPPEQEREVVSFIGSRDPMRAELLADAAQAGLPLEIRGAGWLPEAARTPGPPRRSPSARARLADWNNVVRRQGLRAAWRRATARFSPEPPCHFDFSPHVHPSPPMDGYLQVVANSAVSLGINRFPSLLHPARKPGTYSRLRDIEAPMLGACYLTEWTEGLDSLYELGAEIETYRDADELGGKARALLADPTRRGRMRAAAQKRALGTHTIGHTLTKITDKLGICARK